MKNTRLLFLLSCGICLAGSASAAITFTDTRLTEDFEGEVAGTQATAANTAFSDFLPTIDKPNSQFVEYRDDTTGLFGGDITNGYLRIRATDPGSMGWVNSGPTSGSDFGTIVSYKFTFNDNSAQNSTIDGTAFRISTAAGNTSGGASAIRGTLNQGILKFADNLPEASYSYGTANVLEVVANNSGVNDTYNGNTLESGTFDVYLNGSVVLQDLVFSNGVTTADGAFKAVSFQSYSNANNVNMSVDDVSVSTVPEPSTYALLAGTLALALIMVRRRRG